jgi:putative ABC transport system permease protein
MKNIVQLLRFSGLFLWARPLTTTLNVLMLSLGLAAVTLLVVVGGQLEHAFERDVAGIDAVVGAKGAPLQLILAGVFHLDSPPGNVSLTSVNALARHPQVAAVIPLSLGDSVGGFRIVGTTPDYLVLYGARIAVGRAWQSPLEVVLGAQAARQLNIGVGAQFVGQHGLGVGGHSHGDHPFVVTGVLAPCDCVLDRLVLTGSESVWRVHEDGLAMDEEDRAALVAEREVTMALIRYRSPLATLSFPRWVNSQTEMQAASPALEITRLLRLVGVGTDVLRGFTAVLLLVAGLSVWMALWHAVEERRADLALLRMLGARPTRLALLIWLEAAWLALLSSAVGLALGHALAQAVATLLAAERSVSLSGRVWLPGEWAVPALALGVATLAAAIPLVRAYRTDVADLLSKP